MPLLVSILLGLLCVLQFSSYLHCCFKIALKKVKLICMHTRSLQSRLILCNPMDRSQKGSPIHGILQARILEWGAI